MPNRRGPQTEPGEASSSRPQAGSQIPLRQISTLFQNSGPLCETKWLPGRFDTFRHPTSNTINALRTEIPRAHQPLRHISTLSQRSRPLCDTKWLPDRFDISRHPASNTINALRNEIPRAHQALRHFSTPRTNEINAVRNEIALDPGDRLDTFRHPHTRQDQRPAKRNLRAPEGPGTAARPATPIRSIRCETK